jgi:hypothetical protein
MNVDVKLCSKCHAYKPLCAYYRTFHGLLECYDCNQGKEDNIEYYPPDMICCNKCNNIFPSKDHALSLSIGNKNEAYCKNCAPKIIENLGICSVQQEAIWDRIKEPYIEWVSVKDRMPDDYTRCLVRTSKGIGQALYTIDEGFHDPEQFGLLVFKEGYYKPIESKDVTHWVDLDDIPRPKED